MSEDPTDTEVVTYEDLPDAVKQASLPPEEWENRNPEDIYTHDCLSCEYTSYGVETDNGQFDVLSDGFETNIYNVDGGNLAGGINQLDPDGGKWICERCLDARKDASRKLHGVLPTGETTMVRYSGSLLVQPWENVDVSYDETPLRDALEGFIRDKEIISVGEHRYYDPETDREFGHTHGRIENALGNAPPLQSRDYRSVFADLVLDDEIRLPAPAIITEGGKILTHEAYADAVLDRFESEWNEYKDDA